MVIICHKPHQPQLTPLNSWTNRNTKNRDATMTSEMPLNSTMAAMMNATTIQVYSILFTWLTFYKWKCGGLQLHYNSILTILLGFTGRSSDIVNVQHSQPQAVPVAPQYHHTQQQPLQNQYQEQYNQHQSGVPQYTTQQPHRFQPPGKLQLSRTADGFSYTFNKV